MQDAGLGDAAIGEWPETLPRQAVSLTPASQRSQPVTQHLPPERLQRRHVARDGVVVVVTPHHRLQPRDLPQQGIVTTPHQRLLHPLQLRTQPLAHRLPLHTEAPALALPPTAVGETQEVEGLWPACAPVNASAEALRPLPHDSGSGWLAGPSPYDSFIRYSLPV